MTSSTNWGSLKVETETTPETILVTLTDLSEAGDAERIRLIITDRATGITVQSRPVFRPLEGGNSAKG